MLLLCTLIGGPILIISGIRDYQNSKKLMAEGKAIDAAVVDAQETVSRKSRTHHYYLVVNFRPENGQAVTKRHSVKKEVYDQGIATRSVAVHYLPSDPRILQIGPTVQTDTSSLTTDGLLLSAGVVVLLFSLARSRSECDDSASLEQPELKKAA